MLAPSLNIARHHRLSALATLGLAMLASSTVPARADGDAAKPADASAPDTRLGLPVISKDADALPVTVSPTDRNVRYIGRFDTSDPAGPLCEWTNTEVEVRFTGTALNVKTDESGGSDEYEVVVDGTPTAVIAGGGGVHVYNLYSSPTAGTHTVEVVKRSESFFGTCRYLGFQLPQGGKLEKLPRAPKHKLEVIGDSISVGYGNEAKHQYKHFSQKNSNAYMAYGAVAAREVDAEYSCIAWSGRKMWPNDTMPEIYDRAIATDDKSKWDHAKWAPDAIVINLSTNDFGGKAPDRKGWTDAYKAFLARLRGYYPKAVIYCATSPMMGGGERGESTGYIKQVVDDEHALGDKNVRFLEFAVQQEKDGYGADWHPSLKTDQIMADNLAATLEKDLGWKRMPPTVAVK